MKLGFIGLGLMGGPMTSRLLQAGFEVRVWNRNVDKAAALIEQGAVHCSDIATLVGESDVIMLCLSDTAAVESVVFSAGGVAAHGSSGKTLVDFSSIDPLTTKEFAQRLVKEAGMNWIDAPVSGGTAGAEAGSLIIMAGGDKSVLADIRPAFDPLCQRLTHMGEVGAGQMTKLCNQMVVTCNAAVIAEMVALGRAAGVDVSQLPAALAGGFADSIPFQILVPQMAAHDFTLKWKVATLAKDLNGAVALAAKLGSKTPMSQRGISILNEHAAGGNADRDLSSLVCRYEAE